MQYTLTTLAERPDLVTQLAALEREAWPLFMLKDPVSARYWERLLNYFPQYQLALLNEQDEVVAEGNSVPLSWNGTPQDLPAGWDAALEQGITRHEHGQQPTALAALAILIKPALRGQAISSQMIKAMRQTTATHTMARLIVPVRPSLKSRYPLIPIEEYALWRQNDGLPFDPWIRTHTRLGARVLKVARQSMEITGTVAEWEEWTEIRLPQSGAYVIPQALVPLLVSHEQNEGRYVEPNVWMEHSVPSDN